MSTCSKAYRTFHICNFSLTGTGRRAAAPGLLTSSVVIAGGFRTAALSYEHEPLMRYGRDAAPTLGLLAQGGRDWIAGVVYLQNLVRALNLLPEWERPLLQMFFGPGQKIDAFHELGDLLPPTRSYTYKARQSFRIKLKSTIRHAGPAHWPISLDRLARKTRTRALFPVGSSLGTDFPSPWIAWIPDLQHRRLPQYFTDAELRRRDQTFQKLVEEASQVVVSSRDAHDDLLDCFPNAASRVSTFPFVTVAVPEWYDGTPAETAAHLGLPPKFIIFPSQFWMHKNHRLLFEAIRIAGQKLSDLALVCTGRMYDHRNPAYGDALVAELNGGELRDRVHCVGLLDRTRQVQLIRAAAAVVQPSLFEGWSSLLEDAQALGKRVYVSDIPIHREQNPPNAQFFDPSSSEELASMIVEEWEDLEPGPDPSREQAARQCQEGRALDYARRFMEIFEKAIT